MHKPGTSQHKCFRACEASLNKLLDLTSTVWHEGVEKFKGKLYAKSLNHPDIVIHSLAFHLDARLLTFLYIATSTRSQKGKKENRLCAEFSHTYSIFSLFHILLKYIETRGSCFVGEQNKWSFCRKN